MSTASKVLTRVVLPVGLLALGVGCAGAMIGLAPSAESKVGEDLVTTVDVVEVQPQRLAALVQTTGAVQASRQVVLTTEVAGKVTFVDPRVRPGGRFGEGETLLRLDPRDYRAALAADQARLAQAELEVALERKRQLTAEREWELVGGSGDAEPLALRRPHLKVAEANLASAQAAVQRSELNVSRTNLRAPFNAIVVNENVEDGQVLSAASQAVTLVGTDEVRVLVNIAVDKLSMIQVPGLGGEQGSTVRVAQDLIGGGRVVRPGQVTGVSGQLDPQTRTAQVLVSVPDPMTGEDPLLPGAFVDVEIVGRDLDNAVEVPRIAISEGNQVNVNVGGTLERRTVTIGWRADDVVYVTQGLQAGDQVIVTPIPVPIDGMKLNAQVAMASAEQEQR